MAITINHQTNDISATSGSMTIDGSSVGADNTKMPLAGGTFTGDVKLNDNVKLYLGSDSDVSIEYDPNTFRINAGSWNAQYQAGNHYFRNAGGSVNALIVDPAGAITLKHNNSTKLQTASGGVTITGTATATAFSGDGSGLTNVSASDSTKMPLSGGTFTGDVTFDGATAGYDIVFDRSDNALEFADNAKATFGTGNDLQISHGGVFSNITDSSNALYLQSAAVRFTNAGATEIYATMDSTDGVQLKFGGNTKIQTTSSGVTITGGTTSGDFTFTGASYNAVWDSSDNALEFAANARLRFGNSNDFQLFSNGTTGIIGITNTETLQFQNLSNSSVMAKFSPDGSNELYHNNVKKFETSSTGVTVTGNIAVSGTVDGRDLATDGSKLDGIEASADVTDTANVTAAGALMDSEVTNLSQVKAFDSSDYAAASHTHTFGNITSTSLGSSDDLDSYTTRALAQWGSNNPSNSPSTYGAMLVIPDSSRSQQLVQTYGGATNKVSLYGRRQTGGTWDTSWTQYFSDHYHPNADTLTTARTINGVSFDGSANITIADSTKLPLSGGEMTGALTIDVDNVANGALRIEANQTDTNNDFYFAQEIVSTLSGSQTATADREQGGLWMDINSSNTGGDTSNEHRVYGAYLDVDSTGDADLVYGVYSNTAAAPTTGTTSSVHAGWFQGSDIGGAGNVTNVYGISAFAKSDNSDSDANNLYAGYFKSYNAVDTGDIGSATAVYGEIEIPSGTGDHYGTSYVFNAQYDNNDTTAQTNTTYLYYGNYAGTLPTTAYGVYIADDVDNYFGGSVGIGTNTPDSGYKLDVAGNVVFGDGGGFDMNVDGTRWQFSLGGSEKMRIDSSGNVGIGATSPQRVLVLSKSDSTGVQTQYTNNTTGIGASNGFIVGIDGSENAELWNFHNTNMVFGTNGTERMRITNSGNVGIGTTPTEMLDVSGNIKVTGTVDGRDVATDGTKLDGIEANADVTDTTNVVAALTAGTNVSIAADGTISSTDTNTTYTADGDYGLSLSGTAFRLENDRRRNSSTTDVYSGNTHDYTFYDADVGIRWYTAGSEEMRLEDDGDLHVDGNVIAYSTTISDERLKEDIKPIEGALDKVGQLSGYTFTYKADGKQSAGVIAQEVEAVLPSAVSESTLPLKTDDGVEYKTVQYDQLHGLLIEAIKELKAEIEELKNGAAK